MVQPLKSIVNIDVFMRFHFFDFFVVLMTSGTSWDLILDTFRGLATPFWWFLGVLDMHWNFIDFLDHPKLRQWTWWRVNCQSRGYSIPSTITRLLTCRTSDTRYLTCWWNIERNWGLSVEKFSLAAWWPLASRGRRIFLRSNYTFKYRFLMNFAKCRDLVGWM